MAKGSGSGVQKVAISNTIGGGMFSTSSKKAKQHVGIDCTPEGAFGVTIGLIVCTLALHLVSRFFK